MKNEQNRAGTVLPVRIDTFPGRNMKIPDLIMKNFDTPKIGGKPYLLSPAHMDKMKKLPF